MRTTTRHIWDSCSGLWFWSREILARSAEGLPRRHAIFVEPPYVRTARLTGHAPYVPRRSCVSRATARPPTSSTAMAAEGGFAGTATQRTGAGVRSGIPDQIYGRKQFVGKTLYEP
jgi:hypothetical protein